MSIFDISYPANYIKPPIIDEWECPKEDELFKAEKRYFIAPVSEFWQIKDNINALDIFDLACKKCYNSAEMRNHICKYLNYFEKYYDIDKEYLSMLCRLKLFISMDSTYAKSSFFTDIKRYILSEGLISKIARMVNDNYSLALNYKSITNAALQYTDEHAKLLMTMSFIMNMIIPLLTHFAFVNKLTEIDDFILEAFDMILYMFPQVDMVSKLYETCITNVSKNESRNTALWKKQDVRGLDTVIHSENSLQNIVLNIMPKYTFDKNVISFNFTSINNNTGFQITDIEYEFSYIPLSSSKRDEDSTSDFDKFEANLIKQNEQYYLQNKVNCFTTTEKIESIYGPFDQKEIEFYKESLKDENGIFINKFQKQMIFHLFYKYYGDSTSINAINADEYIKLMISAKKILLGQGMLILPYIISSKVNKFVSRKIVNKKEMNRLAASKYYADVINKYQNPKIINQALSTIASIISSEFKIIDYYNPELNGAIIDPVPDIVIEEYLMYIMLI